MTAPNPAPFSRRYAVTGLAAGAAVTALAGCGGEDTQDASADPEPAATKDPASASSGSSFATTAEIPQGGGIVFADESVVVTQPAAGEFKAFNTTCSHQGCPVTEVTDTINCTCHNSKFSITDGSVTAGPAPSPLAPVAIKVTGKEIFKT